MNSIEALPSLAVFQGAIMKDCVKMALDSGDVSTMRNHVEQLERQLDEFLRQARHAVAEQNGEPPEEE